MILPEKLIQVAKEIGVALPPRGLKGLTQKRKKSSGELKAEGVDSSDLRKKLLNEYLKGELHMWRRWLGRLRGSQSPSKALKPKFLSV